MRRLQPLLGACLVIASLLASGAAFAQQDAPIPARQSARGAPASNHGEPATPLAWSQLTTAQQRVLAPVQGQWTDFTAKRQQHRAQHADRWAALPPAKQQRIRDRLTHWASRPPAERQKLRQRLIRFQHLPPAEQARIRAAFQRFRALPPTERRALRERWRAAQRGAERQPAAAHTVPPRTR